MSNHCQLTQKFISLRCLGDSGLPKSKISDVVLVGGSTRSLAVSMFAMFCLHRVVAPIEAQLFGQSCVQRCGLSF